MKWYIAGSIDNNPDFGSGSRAIIRGLLDDLDIEYFCPALSEENQRNMQQNETLKDMLRNSGDDWMTALKEGVTPIVETDLEGLKDCEGVIVILDRYIGSGTASECTVARELDFPVLGIFVKDEDPHEVSPWTQSRVTEYVDGLEGLREALLRYERDHSA